LPLLLKAKVPFYPALTISALVMVILYYLMIVILKKLGMPS
jgi:prepilin signal peptidase PulO-like enzyme (type II secretory pathway)